MDRPRYPYVVSVLVVIFAFGALLRLAKPLIPPEQPADVIREPSEYARAVLADRIPWMAMGPLALSEARRLDRPLLVLVAAPWSAIGRDLERRAFRDADVRAFVKGNFVAVKVDPAQRPEWFNTFLPVSRVRLGFLPEAQLWLLDSEGRILSELFFRDPASRIDPSWFLARLVEFRDRFRTARLEPWNLEPPGVQQRIDLESLGTGGSGGPFDLVAYAESAREAIGPKGGFVGAGGSVEILPQAFRFLEIAGDEEALRRALQPVLLSPLVDWVDGGIFLRPLDGDLRIPQYDKVAVHNAEMMRALAMADALWPDELTREVAEGCFEFLFSGLRQGEYLAACRVGDERPNGRSSRSSFPPRDLRSAADPVSLFRRFGTEPFDVAEWCRENLCLRVEENPSMVPRLRRPAVVSEDRNRLRVARAWLRRIADSKRQPTLAAPGMADANLTAVANGFVVARLWGDRDKLATVADLWDRLDVLETGGDVARGMHLTDPGSPYLGDYLAFSDAALQDFLATGRVLSLERGLRVLLRARELFEAGEPGSWALTTEAATVLPDARAPEIVDNVGESCTAKAMRLTFAYGRLLRGKGPLASVAAVLSQDAAAALARFSALAGTLGPAAAGFAAAARSLLDDRHAVVVGPGCVDKAASLFRKVPFRLVAPCLGPVRPDLSNGKPGIYVIEGTKANGPLSEEQAVRMLEVRALSGEAGSGR
ncbi:MAG: DUF255 domain-containing protein [Fimbriimonadaceae bacterium]